MLLEERQRIIIEKAHQYGQVYVSKLAEEFDVSDETIRRDINSLASQNKIKKVHGGAIPIRKNVHEESYNLRVYVDKNLKEKIGRYAAGYINDNDVIALDTGTTSDEFASAIKGVRNITIIIRSVTALSILINKHAEGDFTGNIIFLGGEINVQNKHTYGSMLEEQLSHFTIDKAFVTCTSVSLDGIKSYVIEEGVFANMLMRKSNTSYLLAASNKFNKESLYKLCNVDDVDHIITDSEHKISDDLLNYISNSGVNLHIVQ